MQQRPHVDRCCNDVMAAILKIWPHMKNPTSPVDAYLPEEQSRQISSRSDLKRRRPRLFEEDRPNNKVSSDTGSVPETKIIIIRDKGSYNGLSVFGLLQCITSSSSSSCCSLRCKQFVSHLLASELIKINPSNWESSVDNQLKQNSSFKTIFDGDSTTFIALITLFSALSTADLSHTQL